jgi:hypothetical protein
MAESRDELTRTMTEKGDFWLDSDDDDSGIENLSKKNLLFYFS